MTIPHSTLTLFAISSNPSLPAISVVNALVDLVAPIGAFAAVRKHPNLTLGRFA